MVLVDHGVGGVDVLDVVVVQFQVGGQRQRVGRLEVLLERLVVQRVALVSVVIFTPKKKQKNNNRQ